MFEPESSALNGRGLEHLNVLKLLIQVGQLVLERGYVGGRVALLDNSG